MLTGRGETVIGHLTARGRTVIGGLTAEGRIVFPAGASPVSPIPPIPPPSPVPHHSGGGARVWIDRQPQVVRVVGRLRLDLGATGAVRSEQAAIGRVALQLGAAGRVRAVFAVEGRIGVVLGARGVAQFIAGDSADELWLLGLDG